MNVTNEDLYKIGGDKLLVESGGNTRNNCSVDIVDLNLRKNGPSLVPMKDTIEGNNPTKTTTDRLSDENGECDEDLMVGRKWKRRARDQVKIQLLSSINKPCKRKMSIGEDESNTELCSKKSKKGRDLEVEGTIKLLAEAVNQCRQA